MIDLNPMEQRKLAGAFLILVFFILGIYLSLRSKPAQKLKITQLYVYPVKGLRGCSMTRASIGVHGLRFDRTFCLQKVHRDPETKAVSRLETLFIGYNLQLSQFRTSFEPKGDSNEDLDIVVTMARPKESELLNQGKSDQIKFPASPALEKLHKLEVNLHHSTTLAYDMGDEYSAWFSERLGFETKLFYIGDKSRAVLGSLAPNSRAYLQRAPWTTRLRSLVPFMSRPEERLVFNDLAHYLVVTEESNDQVTSRLTGGLKMDVTKFRPNIVVSGASGPFVEDFWGQLTFEGGVQMALTANCYRCQSITVDYDTGKTAADDRGLVWKMLNKDRRVDKGAKYSPVFGRYGFCTLNESGKEFYIGQDVLVTKVNVQRTVMDWPSLVSFGRP